MNDALVDLVRARDAHEARIILAVLHAADIPAITEGDHLVDEWAMSQRLMGQIGTVIRVPASRLEDARAALEEARRTGGALSDVAMAASVESAEGTPDEDEPNSDARENAGDAAIRARAWPGSAVATTVLLTVGCIGLGLLWIDARLQIEDLSWNPLVDYTWNVGATTMTEIDRETERPIAIFEDRDRDQIWERIRHFGSDGQATILLENEDADLWYERTTYFSPRDRRPIIEILDEDGSGFPDRIEIETATGERHVFVDADRDGEFEGPR